MKHIKKTNVNRMVPAVLIGLCAVLAVIIAERKANAEIAVGEMTIGEIRTGKTGADAPKTNEGSNARWLFYESRGADGLREDQKAELDALVDCWVNGEFTDNELGTRFKDYFAEAERPLATAGIMSNALRVYDSAAELPDYHAVLAESCGIYEFIGVYTLGETDEAGRLVCYYWEAGAICRV